MKQNEGVVVNFTPNIALYQLNEKKIGQNGLLQEKNELHNFNIYYEQHSLYVNTYTTFITSVLNIIRFRVMTYKNYLVQQNFIRVFLFLLYDDVLIFVQDRPAHCMLSDVKYSKSYLTWVVKTYVCFPVDVGSALRYIIYIYVCVCVCVYRMCLLNIQLLHISTEANSFRHKFY
jgi:hypothetical protein